MRRKMFSQHQGRREKESIKPSLFFMPRKNNFLSRSIYMKKNFRADAKKKEQE